MTARVSLGSSAAPSGRANATAANLRRALVATLGIAVVVAAEAVPRSLGSTAPLVFVPYSLLIWVTIPAAVTLGIAGFAARARGAELPVWLTVAVAGLSTAAWVSWGIGEPTGWVYGILLGLGGAGAGGALGARWPVSVRVVAAVAIAAVTALLVQFGSVVVR